MGLRREVWGSSTSLAGVWAITAAAARRAFAALALGDDNCCSLLGFDKHRNRVYQGRDLRVRLALDARGSSASNGFCHVTIGLDSRSRAGVTLERRTSASIVLFEFRNLG